MRTVWIPAVALAAGLSIGASLSAQAPAVSLPPGDAARGKAIVESARGNCLSCHRIGAAGSLYGPDLSSIGARPAGAGGRGRGASTPAGATPREALAQSLLDPDASVAVDNRYVRLTMDDGRMVWGKLLNLDTFAVQIFDSNEKLASISRDEVREMTMASPMPSYRSQLSTGELADVVAYLMTLTGP